MFCDNRKPNTSDDESIKSQQPQQRNPTEPHFGLQICGPPDADSMPYLHSYAHLDYANTFNSEQPIQYDNYIPLYECPMDEGQPEVDENSYHQNDDENDYANVPPNPCYLQQEHYVNGYQEDDYQNGPLTSCCHEEIVENGYENQYQNVNV